jgi:regulator of protease activity HflC (stomatin/prohibitin superfamily)
MTNEVEVEQPISGWIAVCGVLILLALDIWLVTSLFPPTAGLATFAFIAIVSAALVLTLKGFLTLEPNEAIVLILFGSYAYSIKRAGFFWANPFFTRTRISLRVKNFNTPTLKVNDKQGNPIEIAAVVTWYVSDTAAAAFDVEDYSLYIHTQCEMALREMAGKLAYESHDKEVSLRGNFDVVAKVLTETVQEHVQIAGITVSEAKITHLAYAPEIAGVMLRRQQADAVIFARSRMVEGALGMVRSALEVLHKEQIVDLTSQQKATLVTNMMTVLLSEEGAQPVIQMGQSSQ